MREEWWQHWHCSCNMLTAALICWVRWYGLYVIANWISNHNLTLQFLLQDVTFSKQYTNTYHIHCVLLKFACMFFNLLFKTQNDKINRSSSKSIAWSASIHTAYKHASLTVVIYINSTPRLVDADARFTRNKWQDVYEMQINRRRSRGGAEGAVAPHLQTRGQTVSNAPISQT